MARAFVRDAGIFEFPNLSNFIRFQSLGNSLDDEAGTVDVGVMRVGNISIVTGLVDTIDSADNFHLVVHSFLAAIDFTNFSRARSNDVLIGGDGE